MLASNLSFSVNTHFCGGEAVKTAISFGNGDLDCGMESFIKDECFQQGGSEISKISSKPCCEDQHESIMLDVDLNSSKSSLNNTNLVFLVLFFASITTFSQRQNIDPKFIYSPPLPVTELTVLLQRFTI